MNVHFVIHEAFEAPGAYEVWVRTRGHVASYSRVHAGEALPQSVDDIDLLVVMGGAPVAGDDEGRVSAFRRGSREGVDRRGHCRRQGGDRRLPRLAAHR